MYEAAKPLTAAQALKANRKFFDTAPELREAEESICPNCGHRRHAQVYKFFGVLSSNGVRLIIAAIVLGMVGFAIWWNLQH